MPYSSRRFPVDSGLHGCRHVANYKEKQRAVKSTLYYNRLPVRWPFAARSGHARPLGHCATHRRRSVDDAAPTAHRRVAKPYDACGSSAILRQECRDCRSTLSRVWAPATAAASTDERA
jgi:hypothetical protein